MTHAVEALSSKFKCASDVADSPGSIALRQHLFWPSSCIAYALVIVGLVLAIHSHERKFLGASVSIVVTMLFFAYRFLLSRAFLGYCEESLRDDLADISRHYKLQPVRPNAEELVPSGPSGFWVVEKERSDKDGLEIVGCVGLGLVRLGRLPSEN